MRSEPRTIAEAIDLCRNRLRSASNTPWLDARLLAQHVTGLDASALIAYGDASLDRTRRQQLFEMAERRAAGEPVAYIVGKKHFCGLEFLVDKRVLVPRPETEELTLACVDDWSGTSADIVDVGTGSGAIACALAHLLPAARLLALDVSSAALEVARDNVARLGLADQISVVESDLFAAIEAQLRFDVIIANLPYVSSGNLAALEPSVQAHEPGLALLGGRDGLDVYRRLLNEAPQRLKAGGALYCECGPDNARELAAVMQRTFPQAAVEIRNDLAGLERMLICRTTHNGPQ